MPGIILVTGAGSGFGALTARTLAHAGHTVYATMRDIAGRNAARAETVRAYADEHAVDLRVVELDVLSQPSADAAVGTVIAECGRLDVLVHNAGHLVVGPTEAFTPEEFTRVFDTNVLGAQRLNRAALPHMRAAGTGLVLWVSSTTAWGGFPPFLGPYAAAKAAADSLAVTTAFELARFGIETVTVVPGAFTSGTEHFPSAGHPADEEVTAAYDARYKDLSEQVGARLSALTPPDADTAAVADAIARVIGLPHGTRPFRTVVDPVDDGAGEVLEVTERVRTGFAERIGIADLLHPAAAL